MIDCKEDAKQQLNSRSHNFLQYFRNWIGFQETFGVITKHGSVLRNAVGVSTLLKNLPNVRSDFRSLTGKVILTYNV